jgi:hypothetical protein
MKIILGNRCSGKTQELFKLADNYNGYIVCYNRDGAEQCFNQALELGYKINKPLTYFDLINNKTRGVFLNKFYFDDVNFFLRNIAGTTELSAITMDLEDYKILPNKK